MEHWVVKVGTTLKIRGTTKGENIDFEMVVSGVSDDGMILRLETNENSFDVEDLIIKKLR